jgi:hypothetical protein
MAGECTNQSVGIMLHAYELQALTEAEMGLFETHLLECNRCFQELQAFEQHSALLLRDSRIRQQTTQVASAEAKSESRWVRLWHLLWPRAPFVFKPAVIYVVALISIISTYNILKTQTVVPVRVVSKTLFFSSTRSSVNKVVPKHSRDAVLNFALDSAEAGKRYHLIMKFQDGTVVFEDTAFQVFDEKGLGTLTLSPSNMKVGSYHVTISSPQPDSLWPDQEYHYTIED